VAISVTCPQCNAALRVKNEMAGKRGKCPHCQGVLIVPQSESLERHAGLPSTAAPPAPRQHIAEAPAEAPLDGAIDLVAAAEEMKPAPKPAGPSPAQVRQQVLAGFRGEIQRVTVSSAYRLGIALTALFMVLLPLIYVSLIGLACYGVYFHLTHSQVMFEHVRGGRAAIFALLIYLAPLAVGAIMIFFMIKPLFAGRGDSGRTRSLTPRSDPLLFEFVERICATVHSPIPTRIDVDCKVNASAHFRRGWLSIASNDLVLTIGLPLAAGMTLQQFAGVLAHEFGHFSQGAGMRLTYVIRSINFWFMRVVYQRDSWDEWLDSSTDGMDLRIAWVLYLAKFFVWVTRKILWGLMLLGHLVAGFMLRQMEFDADRYEARVAGSETFEATCRRLMLLNVGWQGAQSDLSDFYHEGRLVDNLPRLILVNIDQFPPELRQKLDALISESKTGLFDDHPADSERIASAKAEQTPGVFQSELPATVLFQDFDACAKNVSWDLYCEVLGPDVKPSSLHPIDSLLARQGKEKVSLEAQNRFFLGAFNFLRPLRLPTTWLAEPPQPAKVQSTLADARSLMLTRIDSYRKAFAAYDDADTRALEARQARAVFNAGLWPKAGQLKTAFTSRSEAEQHRDRACQELSRNSAQMESFEDAAGERLIAALTLLFDRGVAHRIPDSYELQRECQALMPVVTLVTHNTATLLELRNMNAALGLLIETLDGNEKNQTLIGEILELMKRIQPHLSSIRSDCDRLAYPFDHADGQIGVGRYVLPQVPDADDLGGIYHGTGHLLTSLGNLYNRSVGRLCTIAEMVEADLGFQPLEAAPPPDLTAS
jgi:Zn-dependent protease with chaperone function